MALVAMAVTLSGSALSFDSVLGPALARNWTSIVLAKSVRGSPAETLWPDRPPSPSSLSAVEVATSALRRWPWDERLAMITGKAFWVSGQQPQAVQVWRQLAAIRRERIVVPAEQGYTARVWRRLAAIGEDSPHVSYFLGWGYENLGQPDAALAVWREGRLPIRSFWATYGQTRRREGNSRRALRLAEVMATLEPNTPRYVMALAQEHENWQEWDQAAQNWRKAASILPETDADHWWAMGRGWQVGRSWREAAGAFAKARQLAPEEPRYREAEIRARQRSGDAEPIRNSDGNSY